MCSFFDLNNRYFVVYVAAQRLVVGYSLVKGEWYIGSDECVTMSRQPLHLVGMHDYLYVVGRGTENSTHQIFIDRYDIKLKRWLSSMPSSTSTSTASTATSSNDGGSHVITDSRVILSSQYHFLSLVYPWP
jgi:hypothetical protein